MTSTLFSLFILVGDFISPLTFFFSTHFCYSLFHSYRFHRGSKRIYHCVISYLEAYHISRSHYASCSKLRTAARQYDYICLLAWAKNTQHRLRRPSRGGSPYGSGRHLCRPRQESQSPPTTQSDSTSHTFNKLSASPIYALRKREANQIMTTWKNMRQGEKDAQKVGGWSNSNNDITTFYSFVHDTTFSLKGASFTVFQPETKGGRTFGCSWFTHGFSMHNAFVHLERDMMIYDYIYPDLFFS